tara:strand:- start:7090 stop:7320 length:231 start_codon:yes stop_codon:yes gene_type:complete
MKWILIITVCSSLSSGKVCDPPRIFEDYSSWHSCIESGLDKSVEIMAGIDKDIVNGYLLGPNIYCQRQPEQPKVDT